MQDNERCCGTGTFIIDAQGTDSVQHGVQATHAREEETESA